MKASSKLASIDVGEAFPVRIMGILNVSPESFYTGSVAATEREIAQRGARMIKEGADILDVGGMSTAPYLKTMISPEEESKRVRLAVRTLRRLGKATISVDSTRAKVVSDALKEGAEIVNDVRGLADPEVAALVARYKASLVLMGHAESPVGRDPIAVISNSLKKGLEAARVSGISKRRIVIDPGIGFFREEGGGVAFSRQRLLPWYEWDSYVLNHLGGLRKLRYPIGLSVSRKSFIGKILDLKKPEQRLAGSLAATALAVANGASLLRTHDVAETLQASRVVEKITRGAIRRLS
jgi:dihydropteroate synthase